MTNRVFSFFMPKLDIGGIERVLINYANELLNNGWEVDFVLCRTGGCLQTLLDKNIKIVNLGEISLKKSFFPLRNYLKKRNPAFLYTGANLQNMVCIVSAWRLNTKVIISQHNYFDIDVKHLGLWSHVEQRLMHFLYPKADYIISVSDGIKDYLIGEIGVKKNRITVLPNPIDIEETISRSKDSSIKVPNRYIVFIGRISEVKNLDFLIKAYEKAELDGFSLVFVGDGVLLDDLKEKASKSAKRNSIFFTGSLENPLPFLANASCLVLCSLSEALPTILIEALILNVRIVATPTKGAKEILSCIPESLISNSFDNVSEFANLLEKACESSRISTRCYASKYDKKNIMKQFNTLINE